MGIWLLLILLLTVADSLAFYLWILPHKHRDVPYVGNGWQDRLAEQRAYKDALQIPLPPVR